MRGAGVSVELDLCCWGRMLESDSIKEGLFGSLKCFLLLLSPRENGTFLHQVGQRLEYSRGFGQERPEEVEPTSVQPFYNEKTSSSRWRQWSSTASRSTRPSESTPPLTASCWLRF